MKFKGVRMTVAMIGFVVGLAAGEPSNLSVLKQEIVAYVESGEYAAEVEAVVAPAREFLAERVARKAPGERLAAVLDIDETAISNFAQMRAQDFGYVPPVWDAWVARGEAPAIAPVLELFLSARRAGIDVIFITGRRESDRLGSEKNLRAAGFGDYAALWLKPNGANSSTEQFKTETRRRIEAEGRTIIANIGDQASDLAGGFSERTYKVPGPFYQTK